MFFFSLIILFVSSTTASCEPCQRFSSSLDCKARKWASHNIAAATAHERDIIEDYFYTAWQFFEITITAEESLLREASACLKKLNDVMATRRNPSKERSLTSAIKTSSKSSCHQDYECYRLLARKYDTILEDLFKKNILQNQPLQQALNQLRTDVRYEVEQAVKEEFTPHQNSINGFIEYLQEAIELQYAPPATPHVKRNLYDMLAKVTNVFAYKAYIEFDRKYVQTSELVSQTLLHMHETVNKLWATMNGRRAEFFKSYYHAVKSFETPETRSAF